MEEHNLELHQSLVESATRRALHRLEELGVVQQRGIESTRRTWGTTDESGGTVALPLLSLWLVHRLLGRVADVPVAGSLRDVSADELLWRASDMPDDIARVELEVWVEARGDQAAALLVEALPRAGETGRAMAFRGLLALGPGIAEQVAPLSDDPELSAYALVWRVDTLLATPDEMDAGGDPERLVRVLHAVLVLWGPEAATVWLSPVGGSSGEVGAIEATWRVRLPETEVVLAALGSFHSDKKIAKSARTALFKFRSSGGATG